MSTDKNIHISIPDDGIVQIEMDVPGKTVNLISAELLTELSHGIDSIQADPRTKGIVFLSRKTDHFIGGAQVDVQNFLNDRDGVLAFIEQGRAVYQKISEIRVPTLAAIHGACLGGGLELALACRYRLASDHRKTRLGFPEVMLGILPAWGGTTRLPRLIGLSAALDLLLTGRQLDARQAARFGLVDHVITSKEIPVQANVFLTEILTHGDSKIRMIQRARMQAQDRLMTRFLDRTALGRITAFHQARRNILRSTKGHYPAPLKIIEVVQRGIRKPLDQAMALEQEAMKALMQEEVTRNLLHLFSLRMQAGKLLGKVKTIGTVPPVQKVGVLGAGVMGAGIAQWIVQHDLPVRLRDIHEEAIAKGIHVINGIFDKLVARRRMRTEEKKEQMRLLSATTGYSGFSTCTLVIEAAAERIAIKHQVVRELQGAVGDRAIFATNTSSLSVTTIAEAAKKPDRVLGLHFFNPVSRMPLVEVVRGRHTSDETLLAGVAFAKQIGKTPLIVSDSPGFLVNRILMAYANEACLLLEEGASVESVDRVMETFGMPMGPLTMMDVVGLDIVHHAAEAIRTTLSLDPAQQAHIVDRLFEAGQLGNKTGRGFYNHQGRRKRVNHSGLVVALATIRKERGLSPRPDVTDLEITDRLVMIMANTAAWCLEKGVIDRPGDVDLGLVMGAGFPAFRGGLLKYCDQIGISSVKEKLDRYAASAGSRFLPVPLVIELSQKGQGFYIPAK